MLQLELRLFFYSKKVHKCLLLQKTKEEANERSEIEGQDG